MYLLLQYKVLSFLFGLGLNYFPQTGKNIFHHRVEYRILKMSWGYFSLSLRSFSILQRLPVLTKFKAKKKLSSQKQTE